MKKIGFAALAAMALAFPAVAQAQEGEKLDCAIANTTPEFRVSLGEAMAVRGKHGELPPLFTALRKVTNACAAKWGYDAETYNRYALSRISRDWVIPVLRNAKLDPVVIDKVFDFRTGGANPEITSLSPEQGEAVLSGYKASGVDVDSVPTDIWEMAGGYIVTNSVYWRSRALLTR